MDFNKIKDRITCKLVNKKRNEFPMDDIPHTDFLDLTFVYFVVINADYYSIDSVLVRNDYLREWKISAKELHEISKNNFDHIFEMELFRPNYREKFIMATTKYRLYGGVYMAQNLLLECVADLFEDNLCIIPSSIHEIMLMPAHGISCQDVDETIRKVNRENVKETDFLSDHMYLYSRKTGLISY